LICELITKQAIPITLIGCELSRASNETTALPVPPHIRPDSCTGIGNRLLVWANEAAACFLDYYVRLLLSEHPKEEASKMIFQDEIRSKYRLRVRVGDFLSGNHVVIL